MPESFDVVVVGARCAGSPLAALLAAAGARVAVVDHADLATGTLSSHIFETDGLAVLNRLGLSEKLAATGAPFVDRADIRVEDVRMAVPWPRQPGDVGGLASVRRHLLDPLLGQAAQEAGAQLLLGHRVVGLTSDAGRVTGVRLAGPDGPRELAARVVVGADGRSSTVAKLVGARRYNVTTNRRLLYWGYFENADPGPRPTFISHRWADRFVLGTPTDSGLYEVLVWPEPSQREELRADLEGTFMALARDCEPVATAIAGATRAGRIVGAVRWEGYFRESAGAGWALCGDAGHFKDPAAGRGISDALRQAESLAATIASELHAAPRALDAALARWARARDREFAEHYWLAADMGKAGRLPSVLSELVGALHADDRAGEFLEMLNHRAKPSQVLSPPRLLRATARTLYKQPTVHALTAAASLGRQEIRRRRLNRRPVFS